MTKTYTPLLAFKFYVVGDSGYEGVQEAIDAIQEQTEAIRTDVALLILKYRDRGLKVVPDEDHPCIHVELDNPEGYELEEAPDADR